MDGQPKNIIPLPPSGRGIKKLCMDLMSRQNIIVQLNYIAHLNDLNVSILGIHL